MSQLHKRSRRGSRNQRDNRKRRSRSRSPRYKRPAAPSPSSKRLCDDVAQYLDLEGLGTVKEMARALNVEDRVLQNAVMRDDRFILQHTKARDIVWLQRPKADVLYDYKADDEGHLACTRGDVISVLSTQTAWTLCERQGACGWVPTSYLRRLKNSCNVSEKSG